MAVTGKRGGKYGRVDSEQLRRPDEYDAGRRREAESDTAGQRRKFKGSKINEYTFSDTIHGTHTISARTFAEALRIAKLMGFTKGDYKRKR